MTEFGKNTLVTSGMPAKTCKQSYEQYCPWHAVFVATCMHTFVIHYMQLLKIQDKVRRKLNAYFGRVSMY